MIKPIKPPITLPTLSNKYDFEIRESIFGFFFPYFKLSIAQPEFAPEQNVHAISARIQEKAKDQKFLKINNPKKAKAIKKKEIKIDFFLES